MYAETQRSYYTNNGWNDFLTQEFMLLLGSRDGLCGLGALGEHCGWLNGFILVPFDFP
jgi:hypothetical protein